MTPRDFSPIATKFAQRGVVELHMEPNGSYSVMNEAPTDHCCAAVAAHTRNFWATRTQQQQLPAN